MVKILLLSFKVVYCEIRKISKTLQLLENILYFVQQVRGKEKHIRHHISTGIILTLYSKSFGNPLGAVFK